MTALSINRALTMLNEHRQMLLNSMRNLKSSRITQDGILLRILRYFTIEQIDLGLTLGSLVRKTEMLFQQACWYSCRAGSDTLASETGDLVIDQMPCGFGEKIQPIDLIIYQTVVIRTMATSGLRSFPTGHHAFTFVSLLPFQCRN
ncbi:hypothetical protein T05_6884 [Trichinella murrelli]|uniref:Uncharacterized protein n=1 Tax=Trichinella murrelli TaxID=144512 RepID=A0A0V0U1J0_9BILA|nr:hypothetical protein T05_6884 [Trichinella murrelli]